PLSRPATPAYYSPSINCNSRSLALALDYFPPAASHTASTSLLFDFLRTIPHCRSGVSPPLLPPPSHTPSDRTSIPIPLHLPTPASSPPPPPPPADNSTY